MGGSFRDREGGQEAGGHMIKMLFFGGDFFDFFEPLADVQLHP